MDAGRHLLVAADLDQLDLDVATASILR